MEEQKTAKKQSAGKTKRKLNPYFTKMLDAKKNDLGEFEYNGKIYKQKTTKTGLKIYKKA